MKRAAHARWPQRRGIDDTRTGDLGECRDEFFLQGGVRQQAGEHDGIILGPDVQLGGHAEHFQNGFEHDAARGERRLDSLRPAYFGGGAKFVHFQREIGPEFRQQALNVLRLVSWRQPAGDLECVSLQLSLEARKHMYPVGSWLQTQGNKAANRLQCLLPRRGIWRLARHGDVEKAHIHDRIAHARCLQARHGLLGEHGKIFPAEKPCVHPGGQRQQDQHEKDEAETHGRAVERAFDTARSEPILGVPPASAYR
jgi:hypothetical protein